METHTHIHTHGGWLVIGSKEAEGEHDKVKVARDECSRIKKSTDGGWGEETAETY